LHEVLSKYAATVYEGRTQQNEGKSRHFQSLDKQSQLFVLGAAGEDPSRYQNCSSERRTSKFAGLPEHVKQHALRQFAVRDQERSGGDDTMKQFASLSNSEKIQVLRLAGDRTRWTGANNEGKNPAFGKFDRRTRVRALREAGFR